MTITEVHRRQLSTELHKIADKQVDIIVDSFNTAFSSIPSDITKEQQEQLIDSYIRMCFGSLSTSVDMLKTQMKDIKLDPEKVKEVLNG